MISNQAYINRQTWHHVLEKSKPQINNINRLQAPFQRLLFKSGITASKRGRERLAHRLGLPRAKGRFPSMAAILA